MHIDLPLLEGTGGIPSCGGESRAGKDEEDGH
jgi:hypothetical protein